MFIQDKTSGTFKIFFALMGKGFMISKLFEQIATAERRVKAFVVQQRAGMKWKERKTP